VKGEVTHFTGEVHPLDEWYAHLFYISRRKYAMFMNAKTRFSFVETDATRERLKSLEDIFHRGISKALYEEDYPAETIKMFNDRIGMLQLALTKDRSVLGTMNEFIKDFSYMYTREDRKYADTELGRELRRIPMVKHGFPDKKMKELLSSFPGC
jgi:hypothetical protein